MAFATQVTIGIENRISREEAGIELALRVCYELERGDADLPRLLQEKADELSRLHWSVLHRLGQAVEEPAEPAEAPLTHPASPAAAPAAPEVSSPKATMPTPADALPRSGNGRSGNDAPPPAPAPSAAEPPEAASVPQKLAIQEFVRRLGKSESDLMALLRERFDKVALSQLSRSEAATLLLEMQQGQWNAAPAAQAA